MWVTSIISLRMIILNSRNRKENIYGLPKSASEEKNPTITFPSNTGHKSIGMKLLAL